MNTLFQRKDPRLQPRGVLQFGGYNTSKIKGEYVHIFARIQFFNNSEGQGCWFLGWPKTNSWQ